MRGGLQGNARAGYDLNGREENGQLTPVVTPVFKWRPTPAALEILGVEAVDHRAMAVRAGVSATPPLVFGNAALRRDKESCRSRMTPMFEVD